MAFTLELGEKAPDFQLPQPDGKIVSLADFNDRRILIVVFSCNHCPFVTGSEDRMNSLYEDYISRSVAMVAINSNETDKHPTDSIEHMALKIKEKGFKFPYLRDESQQVALAYGALRTPHYYVFDQQRRLQYTGRMDDNPREPGKESTHELRDALEALLAGNVPPVQATNPIGCNVKWKDKDAHWMPPEACDLV